MKAYYDARAPEYDQWYTVAARDRPGFAEDLHAVEDALAALPPAKTLDVACGTGFLTRHLRGEVTGIDQSGRMLEIARERIPGATFVQGDALRLPFEDRSFERVVTGHFYGHLEPGDQETFLTEARRVARELVVVDASSRNSDVGEEWQERVLADGTRWQVFKRFFTGKELAAEVGGGDVLHEGGWFVVVRS